VDHLPLAGSIRAGQHQDDWMAGLFSQIELSIQERFTDAGHLGFVGRLIDGVAEFG
jgi:hypothetical protein